MVFSLKDFCLPTYLLISLLLGCCGSAAQEYPCDWVSQQARCAPLNDAQVVQPPMRVLLVPLLKKAQDSDESERWPEYPAVSIQAFYRDTFHAEVVWMRDVRRWKDYYQQVAWLLRQSVSFDRVIFIGHGGFDGPILNPGVFGRGFTIETGKGKLFRGIESQPGLQQPLTITYDVSRNLAFSTYIASHWQELLRLDVDAISILQELGNRLQPLDGACFKHCLSEKAVLASDGEGGANKLNTCEWVCRTPLFLSSSVAGIAPDRFLLFAHSLRSLVSNTGLIMLGFCNPGTLADEGETQWVRDGMLVNSTLGGAPYESYVDLLAAATGRTVVGPIGKTSAEDIVVHMRLLEGQHVQRYLRIATPASRAGF